MRLTKGAQTQHNPNPNIQCWRNIFSRKWEKGKESEHFFSSVTLSSLLFPLVWNLVKPLIYSSEFVNFVSFSHLGPFFFVFCIVNLAWFVKIQVGFCFMWSGFDLIGLGYVYLQPWFDFFLIIIRGLNVMTFGVICCTVIVLILILVLASDFVLLLCLWFCGNLIVKI